MNWKHMTQKENNGTAKYIFYDLSSALKCFSPKDFVM